MQKLKKNYEKVKEQALELGQDASENPNISNKNFQKKTGKKEGKKTSDFGFGLLA